MEFELEHGIKITENGVEETHKKVTLRELTAADLFAAQEASEVLRVTPKDSIELVMSNARLGREILRRAIVSIGNLPGPISEKVLSKLSGRDYNTLVEAHNAFEYVTDQKTAKVVEQIEKKGN